MYKINTQTLGIPLRYVRKFLLVMRLTTLLLILTLMQVSAATLAQRINLNERKTPLENVLKEIRHQSGYDIYYDGDVLPKDKKVDVTLKDATVDQALKAALNGLSLDYKIDGKTIVITKKTTSFLDNIKAAFALIDVHGRVVDETGKPLPGVTVRVKDGSQATITNQNGEFEMKKVTNNAVLVLSFIGYSQKEIAANGDLAAIRMEMSNSKLDEVQVIAYGQTSRRLSVGNITTIKGADIVNQPVTNPLLAISGRVPGLNIIQMNGYAGGGITVRVQGQNSIENGNDPLYVIDGVPYLSQMIVGFGANSTILGNSSAGSSGGGAGNPLNFIDPRNIESIDVLKDADATAIYGSRAANGAILITTKKGAPGKMKISIDAQAGIGNISHFIDLLNTTQYLSMRHEAIKNDGLSIGKNDYDINGTWDTTRNINWQKELIGHTAHYSNFSGDLSGGSENIQYLLGGSYNRQTTVLFKNFDDQKGNFHFNLSAFSSNKKFNINFSGSYQSDRNQLPGSDLTLTAITLAPDAPPIYTADGALNWAPSQTGASTWFNPAATTVLNKYVANTKNLIADLNLRYHFTSSLNLRLNVGYNDLTTNEFNGSPLAMSRPEDQGFAQSLAYYGQSGTSSWIIEPQLNYHREVAGGQLEVLLGSTVNRQAGGSMVTRGAGFTNDALLTNIAAASTVTAGSTVDYLYRYNALFGRVNYNWRDRYLVDVTFRRDGSSSFGSENLFHNFSAIGAGWIFSNESWLKQNRVISFGKIKGSYGTTGNDQIGYYRYLNLFQPGGNHGVPYQGASGLIGNGLPNPYLQWEETTKLMVGIDFGFIKDRILFSGSYSKNRSSNQLLPYALPIITGANSIISNFPALVQNTNWEFLLNSKNIDAGHFKWTTNFNLTIPKNKLLAFPNLETSSYNSTLVIGQPVSMTKAFNYAGVDPQTGIYQFRDATGNLTFSPDPQHDMVKVIQTSPYYYAGLSNSIFYRQFQLDFLIRYVRQRVNSGIEYNTGLNAGRKFLNQPVKVLERWQKEGDNSSIQKFNSNFDLLDAVINFGQSDVIYQTGSFLRLQNVVLNYSLPKTVSKKMFLDQCNLFVQGQNLLTFTRFKGLDPETGSVTMPPLRVITLGVHANF